LRIIAFVDIHGNMRALEEVCSSAVDADIMLCSGDLTQFSNRLDLILRKLDSIGKPLFLIHGNHETSEEMADRCRKLKNIEFVHKRTVFIGNTMITGYGGGGFSEHDKEMGIFFSRIQRDFIGKIDESRRRLTRTILLTHSPPYGTHLDELGGSHHGNRSITSFLKKNKINVILNICGHFHENAYKDDRLGRVTVINPGPAGTIIEA